MTSLPDPAPPDSVMGDRLPEQVDAPVAISTSDGAVPPPRTFQRSWPLTVLAFALATSVLVVFLLTFTGLFSAQPVGLVDTNKIDLPNWIGTTAGAGFVFVWILFFGASFGSFVNCVVWRLPRGLSVVGRASACPACGQKLRGWQNVPLFGWLWLNGQCGHCAWPIPSRYFWVELVYGLAFVAIAYGDVTSGGASAPLFAPEAYAGVLWTVMYPKAFLWRPAIWHFAIVALLGMLWLLVWDRKPYPWKTTLAALLGGAIVAAVFPDVLPVSWKGEPHRFHPGVLGLVDERMARPDLSNPATGLVTFALGALAGVLLAIPLAPGLRPAWRRDHWLGAMALIGAGVGWQGAVSVALWVAAFATLVAWEPVISRRHTLALALPAAFLAHVLSWRFTAMAPIWPGPHSGSLAIAIAAVIAVAWTWTFARPRRRVRRPRRRSTVADQSLVGDSQPLSSGGDVG